MQLNQPLPQRINKVKHNMSGAVPGLALIPKENVSDAHLLEFQLKTVIIFSQYL